MQIVFNTEQPERGTVVQSSGLTLLEVLIALIVFGVGILAAAAMAGTSMHSATTAQKGIYNSVAAARQIEEMLALAYDDPLLSDNDNGYYPSTPDHGPFDIPASGSHIEWEVADDFPAPGTKRISVTVYRAGRGGNRVSFMYEYVKARDFR